MNEQENNKSFNNGEGFAAENAASEVVPADGGEPESVNEPAAYMAEASEPATESAPVENVSAEIAHEPEPVIEPEPPYRSYTDANFQSGNEMTTPRSYYTPPQKIEKKKKEKKGVGFGGLIAACLICAILGGLAGGAIMLTQTGNNPGVYGNSSLNVSNGGAVTAPDASTISAGKKLTGAEIYALGCEQAVGITTEITYRNYFGMETSSAVSGSGFIVTENGYIVTNYHVIRTAYEGGYDVYVMLYNGESYKADIVGFEKNNDLAVLKINITGLPAATLGNSDNLLVGDAIYAIGNPLGELNFSMTSGSVSALDRSITTTDANTGAAITNNMFQVDAAVNEGNSGGPVYNDKGEVVGIVTAKYADTGVEGLGFAIPINDVMAMIQDLIEHGYVTGKPSFGITAKTLDSVSASYYKTVAGAEVVSVTAGSCSDKAGVKVGDIITAVGEVKVGSTDELINAKKDYKAGDTVTITVYREGQYLELSLTFDEESAITTQAPVAESTETPNVEREKLPVVPKEG